MAATSDDGPTTAPTNRDDTVVFGPHAVVLIDFLGQASELAKWDFAPGTAGRRAEWLSAVQNSMGRVLAWRTEFEERFRQGQVERDRFAEQFSAGRPAELRRQLDKYRQTSLHAAHFSDTLIFCSPLQNEHGYWQVANMVRMVATCGILMLAALYAKAAFRGAIEVGMLSRFPTGDPYGPALSKAHRLEAKVADYPRIIVGPDLSAYLDAMLRNPGTDAPAEANRNVAAICREYIAQDTDGCWIVDYLNESFADLAAGSPLRHQVQAQACAFVQVELDRFTKAGDDKLAKRYERLLAYFRSRGVT
jgi:hypothetical protein